MKRTKTPIILKFIFKLAILIILIIGLLFGLYLFIKKNNEPRFSWAKVKQIPNVNFFKFIGWKLWIFVIIALFLAGILYRYPVWKIVEGLWQRRKFIEFAGGVHMAVVSADVGKGKTLLLSILARYLPKGIKKVGFVSNVPDAKLLSYNDINFDEPVSKMDNYRIPKYYFLDETNFWIDGVQFTKNRLFHKGVAWLLQISRHHQMHLWISATRDNHVWVAVREIVNYYVKLGGLEHVMDFGRFSFFTLRIQFYSQSWELKEEFNILVSNLDFNLYDSYWLKDTSYFRQTLEENVEHSKTKWRELSPQDKEFEEEAEKQFQGKQSEITLQLTKNYNFGKDSLTNFHKNLNYQKFLPSKSLENSEPKVLEATKNSKEKIEENEKLPDNTGHNSQPNNLPDEGYQSDEEKKPVVSPAHPLPNKQVKELKEKKSKKFRKGKTPNSSIKDFLGEW